MFCQFILPFDVRGDRFTYEWMMYKAIDSKIDLCLLAPEHYWTDIEERKLSGSWATLEYIEDYFRYKAPSPDQISQIQKIPLLSEGISELEQDLIGPNLVWAHTITQRIPSLERHIRSLLEPHLPLEAILIWTNCASVTAVAADLGIKVIHNELGPLRPPRFQFTAYFDFEGVNGRTSASTRWQAFLDEKCTVPIMGYDELDQLFSNASHQKPDFSNDRNDKDYDVGVALQCPDDSNMLAFSNGFSNYEAIVTALRYFTGRTIVRPHPARAARFDGIPVTWDASATSSEFLDKINAVITVNSSVGFEALLRNNPAYILGESSFKDGSWNIFTKTPPMERDLLLRWVNWFLFGYLIPFDRLFNQKYYRWRLKLPSELDIYTDNFRYWCSRRAKEAPD